MESLSEAKLFLFSRLENRFGVAYGNFMLNIKDICFGGNQGGTMASQLGALFLRIFAGLGMALGHGYGKLPPPEGFVEGVADLGFPLPWLFAWAAAIAEFFGGLLLALGLLTRPAAFLILCTMLVAAFGRHAADPFSGKEMALLYAFITFFFVMAGGGRFSLDRFLR